MKKIVLLLAAILVLLCGAAVYLHLDTNYTQLRGQQVSYHVEELDLSGQPLTEYEQLFSFTSLKKLDVTESGITAEQYERLRKAFPDCEISWSVPFQGSFYPENTKKLTVSSITREDMAVLPYFPQLTAIDANGCTDYAMLASLQESYPHLAVEYYIPLGDQKLSLDSEKLVIGNGTAQQLAVALEYLPNVTSVDARGCTEYQALQQLQAQYPDCRIVYTVEVGGVQWYNHTPSLVISDPDLAAVEAAIPALPQLSYITFTGTLPTNDELLAFQQAHPDIPVKWSFDLCGVTVSSTDTEIDLSNIKLPDTIDVEAALKYFYNLEKVVMCDCGISNQEMDELWKRHPETRFVWSVWIGRRIHVRTDIIAFMPYQFGGTLLTDEDTANMKYLVDLVVLDLGHNKVTDVSFLQYMPKIKYLILADSPVRDISAVAYLKELVYFEVFMTNVRNYKPLLECKNLVDLNISYSIPQDITIFYEMQWLEHLWMRGYWEHPGYIKQADIQKAMPNTEFVFGSIEDISSTGAGWRQLPNYFAMRDLLGMGYMTG